MATGFDTTAESALGAFVESPLRARGGAELGILYAGGDFTAMSGTSTQGLARYDADTTTWVKVASNLTLSAGSVAGLAVHGGVLYVSGAFVLDGTESAAVAVYDADADTLATIGYESASGNTDTGGLASFGGYLWTIRKLSSGAGVEVWRWNGTTWSDVTGSLTADITGAISVTMGYTLWQYGGALYAGVMYPDTSSPAGAGNLCHWDETGADWVATAMAGIQAPSDPYHWHPQGIATTATGDIIFGQLQADRSPTPDFPAVADLTGAGEYSAGTVSPIVSGSQYLFGPTKLSTLVHVLNGTPVMVSTQQFLDLVHDAEDPDFEPTQLPPLYTRTGSVWSDVTATSDSGYTATAGAAAIFYSTISTPTMPVYTYDGTTNSTIGTATGSVFVLLEV